MHIKLDENLPAELVDDLAARGHNVDSVEREGLAGAPDSVVTAAARRSHRVLFTLDKGVADVRRFPPQQYAGVVLFRVRHRGRTTLRHIVLDALAYLPPPSRLVGRLLVVTESSMRLRR